METYTESQLKQFAFECVANFLSSNEQKVEVKLIEVIIDRNEEQFKKFEQKNNK